MITSQMTDSQLAQEVAAERRDLAELLSSLPARSWDSPTLCAGWRVRELVAHVTMPFRYSAARFVTELVRSGGRFNAMADRCARRDGAAPASELLAALRDNATNPWTPPGGGLPGALTHDMIHGLDAVVPLGIDRRVPQGRLRIVLESVSGPQELSTRRPGAGPRARRVRQETAPRPAARRAGPPIHASLSLHPPDPMNPWRPSSARGPSGCRRHGEPGARGQNVAVRAWEPSVGSNVGAPRLAGGSVPSELGQRRSEQRRYPCPR